jgi:norsolorinic acid ketoreductase
LHTHAFKQLTEHSGIGLGLTQSLLRRPNTTVIACIRDRISITEQNLHPSDRHVTSNLETITLESTSDKDFNNLRNSLVANGTIRRIDVAIANAGSSAKFASVLDTPLDALRSDFEVNTLGPLRLFQTCYDNLSIAPQGKFVLISSILGSIGVQDVTAGPMLAYGTSKAAANFLIRKIHCEYANIVAITIHPG